MEGAFLAGIDLSQGKARSALRFEEPTAKIEAAVHDGRYALVTAGLSRCRVASHSCAAARSSAQSVSAMTSG